MHEQRNTFLSSFVTIKNTSYSNKQHSIKPNKRKTHLITLSCLKMLSLNKKANLYFTQFIFTFESISKDCNSNVLAWPHGI